MVDYTPPNADWSDDEVAVTVAAYLRMLTMELASQAFNKSEHRRALQLLLPNRSEGAIEFKHSNISAVMLELGYPYIRGYQPRKNFQRRALFEEVIRQVIQHPRLDDAATRAVALPAETPLIDQFDAVRVDAPKLELKVQEETTYLPPTLSKRDYLAQEARNRSLGRAGEEFVVHYERLRLERLGRGNLSSKIEHTAAARGDGAGYDVLSFEENGRERFIEVKTTAYAKDTPFFISDGELAFAKANEQTFRLYRLFEFRRQPRLFELQGRLDTQCRLDPISFRASFA